MDPQKVLASETFLTRALVARPMTAFLRCCHGKFQMSMSTSPGTLMIRSSPSSQPMASKSLIRRLTGPTQTLLLLVVSLSLSCGWMLDVVLITSISKVLIQTAPYVVGGLWVVVVVVAVVVVKFLLLEFSDDEPDQHFFIVLCHHSSKTRNSVEQDVCNRVKVFGTGGAFEDQINTSFC